MDQVKNARLDLDNQKRKLANSTEAERKAHYEAKVRRSCGREAPSCCGGSCSERPVRRLRGRCAAQIVKAQETLDEELDYLRQILTILLAEDEEKKVQRASVRRGRPSQLRSSRSLAQAFLPQGMPSGARTQMMAMMQAMRDYHAKALAALQELDKKLDFDANSEYTPQPKPVPRRRERKAGYGVICQHRRRHGDNSR